MLGRIILVFILLVIISVVGFGSVRYLQGYELPQIIGVQQPNFSSPDPSTFRQDLINYEALRYLSNRWQTDISSLKIMSMHLLIPSDLNSTSVEQGIVDPTTYNSARIIILDGTDNSSFVEGAIDHVGNVYLMNEFLPTTPQEKQFAEEFYTTSAPGFLLSRLYASIVSLNISDSGDGSITALSNDGILTVPVKFGLIFKRLTY